MEILDLFIDVGDGVILMKLLEIISGEKLGKPNRGRMRVQKIENLNTSLDFLKRKRIQVGFIRFFFFLLHHLATFIAKLHPILFFFTTCHFLKIISLKIFFSRIVFV